MHRVLLIGRVQDSVSLLPSFIGNQMVVGRPLQKGFSGDSASGERLRPGENPYGATLQTSTHFARAVRDGYQLQAETTEGGQRICGSYETVAFPAQIPPDGKFLACVRLLMNPPRNSPPIEATDSLLVAKLTAYDFQGWLPKGAWEWLNKVSISMTQLSLPVTIPPPPKS